MIADFTKFAADFHFLRPGWLLAVIPATLLFVLLWHQGARLSVWRRTIDQALLPHLLDTTTGSPRNWPFWGVLVAWLLACVGMAGPVWEKLPQPVSQKEDALVIIQDLSLSFYARDLSPDRLTRARHKLTDILKTRKEGTTALIVYSGSAYVVAPLTDDAKTISSMVPALSPAVMPEYGANLKESIELALTLFRETAVSRGKILLLTDEVSAADLDSVTELLADTEISLAVIGVGTETGGPIPLSDGGFLKDDQGTIIVPRMNRALLQKLAAKNRGLYSDIQLTDQDIEHLLAPGPQLPGQGDYKQSEREFDQWQEQGVWLVFLLLPLGLAAFRRGWVLVLLLCLVSQEASAFTWDDLWQRRDQQAAQALAADDSATAAKLFDSPGWQGTAAYKAGDYPQALEAFGKLNSGEAYYNRGNSLARMKRFAEAKEAYEQALELNPDLDDARFNLGVMERLLAQQEERQQSQAEQGEPSAPSDSQKGDRQDGAAGQEKSEEGAPTVDQDPNQAQSDGQQGTGQSGEGQPQAGRPESKESPAGQPEESPEQAPGQRAAEPSKTEDDTSAAQAMAQGEETTDDQQVEPEEGGGAQSMEPLSIEQQQALEQWLRQVPDNPGGLLRRKFEYQSRANRARRQGQPTGKIW